MRYLAFILVLLAACKMDSDKTIDRDKFTFKTGDDTELFFKNVRQSDYDLEENKAAKFNVFRHEDRARGAEVAINIAIVVNYLNDEAYLLVEPSEELSARDEIVVKTASGSEIVLNNFSKEGMLEFASQIYEQLLKEDQFFVLSDGEQLPVLADPGVREAYRITVSDYYRLTRVY